MDKRRKAVEDVRILEESIRRMTEKEKGKSKAVDKVKRERDCKLVLIPLCYHPTDDTPRFISTALQSQIITYFWLYFNCSCWPQPSGSNID